MLVQLLCFFPLAWSNTKKQKRHFKGKSFRRTVRATWMQIVNMFCQCVFDVYFLQAKWAKLCGVPFQAPHTQLPTSKGSSGLVILVILVLPVVLFVARWANWCPCVFSVDVVKHLSFFNRKARLIVNFRISGRLFKRHTNLPTWPQNKEQCPVISVVPVIDVIPVIPVISVCFAVMRSNSLLLTFCKVNNNTMFEITEITGNTGIKGIT